MKRGIWAVILIVIALLCMMDFAEASEKETKPTYKIVKMKSGKYKTTFRKNGKVFYSVKTSRKPTVKFVKSEAIHTEKNARKMLENRKGKATIYVENDLGVVLNKNGDGQDRAGFYVCYRRVPGVRFGTLVRSYFIYDPNNNYIDGIEGRCDYIVRK